MGKKVYEKPSYEVEEILAKLQLSCKDVKGGCPDKNNPSKIEGGGTKKTAHDATCKNNGQGC